LEDVVPGSHVSQSMIRLDKKSGVLFCHGNIWNLPEVPLAFKRSESLGELSESLTETNLAASLETAQVAERLNIKNSIVSCVSLISNYKQNNETSKQYNTIN
jgi:hypothetical protein